MSPHPRYPNGQRNMFQGSLPTVCIVLLAAVLLLWQRQSSCECDTDSQDTWKQMQQSWKNRQQQQQQQRALPCSVNLIESADLSVAHMLLPLTNFSNITTATLIDAHPSASSSEVRDLMRLHQGLYCSARMNEPAPPGASGTSYKNMTLFVYNDNDIVSKALSMYQTWEGEEIKQMLYAMKAPVPLTTADLSSPSKWQAQASPFVIDVGANVGWFTINAAANGATVAAFEAMGNNVRLVRASLCANPWIMKRVALYGTGLGTKRSDCHILSGVINRGDGHTVCDEDPYEAAKQWKINSGYEYAVRGSITVMRLDKLIDHDVQVLKIDVEGFETKVLTGAEGIFDNYNVWFIMTECNIAIIGEAGVTDYLKFLDRKGYYISNVAFTGPFMKVDDIRAGKKVHLLSVNLYCVKKDMQDAIKSHGPIGRRHMLSDAL